MKQRTKKLISLFLTMTLILSFVSVYAEETSKEVMLVDEDVNEAPSGESMQEDKPLIVTVGKTENKERTVFYVATDGSDKNDGTFENPFATIEGARDAIRKAKQDGTLKSGGAIVYIRGGEYTINKGIVFEKEDSGTEDAPIIYRNYMDEVVDFVGGKSLNWDDFVKVTDQAVLDRIVDKASRNKVLQFDLFEAGFTDLPEIPWPGSYSYWETVMKVIPGLKKPIGSAPELVINGKGMTVARYPNDSELQISAVYEPGSTDPAAPRCSVIGFEDNRIDNWTQAKEIILYGTPKYSWGTLATTVGKIEPDKNRVHTKYPIHHQPVVDQYMYFFNLLEEIDMPGEYFVDREKGMLYLYPPAEEVKSVVYTTLEDNMLTVNGAKYLTFKNINLKYMRNGAFRFVNNPENCNMIGAEITYTGAHTAYIYGKNNKVLDCYVHDVEGPVELIGGVRETLEKGENLVENSKFQRTNRLTSSYSPAVTVGGVGNIARHNDISDSIHTVMTMSGNLHLAAFNEIYDACRNTDDMGAIYTGRNITHRGNVFRYNYIHDIGGANRGGNGVHGMFFDDWWSAADVVGNVFADITGAGSYNVMDNNMFINCGESMRLTRSFDYGNPDGAGTNWKTYTDGVLPYMTQGIWLETFPEMVNAIDENGAPDMNNYIVARNNVLFNAPEPGVSEQVAKTATVENNVVFRDDPGFYDLENKNYLLKDDSEVYEKIEGFCPIPFTRMGLYSDRALARTQNAFVYCADSPFAVIKGKKVNKEKVSTIVENGEVYVTLREGAEIIGGTISYDEETEQISLSTKNQMLEFKDGEKETVLVNGSEYKLSKPIVNISDTNYISASELSKIFKKYLFAKDNMVVFSDRAELFTEKADAELLRYLHEIISVY